jgi:hypothetical protein
MASIASSLQQPRLVLCPYGIAAERRSVCTSLLLKCGGDVSRLIDEPSSDQAFLKHLRRLRPMLEAVRPPIVMLTSLLPLMTRVVLMRERYEAELAPLRHADWLLFLDEEVPAFVQEALRRGRLERGATTAIWHGPARMRFLVVSADSDDPVELRGAMASLQSPSSDPLDLAASSPKLPITRTFPRPQRA